MQYDPSKKHKSGQSPSRRGSLCPPGVNASGLLRSSVLDGRKRFATDGQRAFCGQCHDWDRDLWHGYPIDWDEVPPKILRDWIYQGAVSSRTVKRARRRR